MHKILGYVLALIVLCGLAYAIYTQAPRVSPALQTASITEHTGGTEVKTDVVYGSTPAYKIEVHYPVFGIPAVDAKIKSTVDTAVNAFKQYPPNPPEMSSPQNEFVGSFDSAYVGPDVVSVALTFSEYTGGAHSNNAIFGVNIDPRTGKELTLDDALALTGKTLQQVSAESLAQLKAKFGADIIFPEGADPKPANYAVFLVGKDKVTFVFNVYQVAPYAAGPQYVEFPRIK